MSESLQELYERAADALANADALVIATGAGMGVDSGLPDFRGRDGFWRAYPAFKELGLDFMQVATPRTFHTDPELAWGFYGHRFGLYRRTEPHQGFQILRGWSDRFPLNSFVFTSNVDGHFQRAGFYHDRIVEIHGRIDRWQCVNDCGFGVFPAPDIDIEIDPVTMRAKKPLPTCPSCGDLARPNILMFGDRGWDYTITGGQEARFHSWMGELPGHKLVVLECGAGTAIPTVRLLSEDLCDVRDATLIRINPSEPEVPSGHIAIPTGALQAIQAIDQLLQSKTTQ